MSIRSTGSHYGRNRDGAGTGQPYPPASTQVLPPYTISATGPQVLRDDRFVRCKKCGFICNLDRDRHLNKGSHVGTGIRIDVTAVPR